MSKSKSRKKGAEARLGAAGARTCQGSRPEQPDVSERSANLRPRDSPHAQEIAGDIPNYTDVSPVLQISEVVVERS